MREGSTRGMSRRGEFSHNVSIARVAEVNLRESVLRGLVSVAMAGVVLAGGGAAWCWAPIACGAIASYLSVRLNVSVLSDEPPRSVVVRAALDSARGGQDRYTVNITGVLEGAALVGFAAIAAWGVEAVQWRLAVIALATLWAVSQLGATFVDPAFYQSDQSPPSWLEGLRRWVGPLVALIIIVVAYAGPAWPDEWVWTPAAIAVGALWLTWRISELDGFYKHAYRQAQQSELTGRRKVLASIHSEVSTDLKRAIVLARELYPDRPDLYEQLLVLGSRLNSARVLEQDVDVDTVSTARAVEEMVERITAVKQATFTTEVQSVGELASTDLELFWLLVNDLVQNGVDAGARHVEVSASREGSSELLLDVIDDAGGIDPRNFCMPGSSLERLRHLVTARAGSLELLVHDGSTHVRARWRSQFDELT